MVYVQWASTHSFIGFSVSGSAIKVSVGLCSHLAWPRRTFFWAHLVVEPAFISLWLHHWGPCFFFCWLSSSPRGHSGFLAMWPHSQVVHNVAILFLHGHQDSLLSWLTKHHHRDAISPPQPHSVVQKQITVPMQTLGEQLIQDVPLGSGDHGAILEFAYHSSLSHKYDIIFIAVYI